MREGCFAKYKGKEYKVYLGENKRAKLVHYVHSPDRNEDFFNSSPDKHFIEVGWSELESPYTVNLKARYKGIDFSVFGKDLQKREVSLTTEDEKVAEKLGFDRADKFYWEKWVPVTELEKVWEVKTELKL